jgi:quinolinate synthase
MLLWDGACHVHERFSVHKLIELKKQHPDAKVLVHPECKGAIVKLADVVGSTAALLNYTVQNEASEFIVVTESGILYEMGKRSPQKKFIPLPPEEGTSPCNECQYMRMITLPKVYNSLLHLAPQLEVDAEVSRAAVKSIHAMLDISEKLGL